MKATWQTELFNACSTECAFRQRWRFIGVVHDKGDGCKCEATLKCISAWLCPWCKDITVIRFVTDTNSTKGAALRKHSSAVLDTPRGRHLSQHVAPLEGPMFKTCDRGWELDNLQLLTTLPGRESNMLNAHCHFYVCFTPVRTSWTSRSLVRFTPIPIFSTSTDAVWAWCPGHR